MKAKKSLGQHFLKDEYSLERIADAGNIKAGETVVEVGPGHGELTRKILSRGANVIAVEKDEVLAHELGETCADAVSASKLTVIMGDVQNFSFPSYEVRDARYKLIANIPYYMTGTIIRQFLSAQDQPSRLVLLIQKEVAERIVAADGKESLLSLSVKAYGSPRLAGLVKKGAFRPVPGVDSAILVVEDISRRFFTDISEEQFFELLHASFAEKRKQLLPKLKRRWPSIGQAAFEECGIEQMSRAEDVSLPQYRCLTQKLPLCSAR